MHKPQSGQPRALLLALSFVAPFLLLTLYWFRFIRPDYFPSEDEFALIVSSTRAFHPSIAAWFTHGFSLYFQGYPGLSQPATDFIRPVVNAAYYLNSILFGTHWAAYLLLTYAVQAALVFLSVKLALQALRLPIPLALFTGLLVFLSPAFGWQQLFLTSFTFDLFGSFFVLFALHELWRHRPFNAWLLLLLAVFTKETTLFAPGLVACAIWLPTRKPLSLPRRATLSFLWLLPILAWATLRSIDFHGHAGVYVLQSTPLKAQALAILHGFLAWPFGTRTAHQSIQLRLLFFPLNTLFWLACLAAAVAFLRHRPRLTGLTSALVFFTFGALAMPLLLNLPQRFGAVFYPLFFLLLAALSHSIHPVLVRRTAFAALLITLATTVYQKAVDPWSLPSARAEWTLSRSFIASIHATHAPTLLLLNDVSGAFTSPTLIARFAAYPGTLIRIDNLDLLDLARCPAQPAVRALRTSVLTLTSQVTPPCAFYTFDSVPPDALTRTPLHTAGITLTLPPLRPLPLARTPAFFGPLTALSPDPSTPVLTPNLQDLQYHLLP